MRHQEIFDSDPQSEMDLGQPKQNAIQFPVTLAERYQPRHIAEFIGLEHPKRLLTNLIAKPRPCPLLFIGPPGAGKTAMGVTFAVELPGALHHVSAQKCDVAALDALGEKFSYAPPKGRFWISLIDEADQMTEKAQLQLLSRLDGTAALRPVFGGGFERGEPLPIIWIFTANGRGPKQIEPPYSFASRFLSRCMIVPFELPTQAELAAYLCKLWKLEGGGPTPADYFDYIADDCAVRDALMKLEVDLLAGPRARPVPEITDQPQPKPVTCDRGANQWDDPEIRKRRIEGIRAAMAKRK